MISRFYILSLLIPVFLLSSCSWVDSGVGGNIPPRSADDVFTVDEGGLLEIPTYEEGVLGNDEDGGANQLVARLVEESGPLYAQGFEFLPDGRFLYKHSGEEPPSAVELDGTARHCDFFSYIANDGIDDGEPKEVCIDIRPVNDPPLISGQKTVPEVNDGVAVPITLADLDVADPDSDPAALQIVIEENSEYYRLEQNTVSPNENYSGVLKVKLMVNDGADASEPFFYEINVIADNDAPVISQKVPLETLEETPLQIRRDEHLVIVDPDNVPEDFILIVEEGDNYSVGADNQTVIPDKDFTGLLEVGITLIDNEGQKTGSTLEVTVTPDNDGPPEARDDQATTAEDNAAINIPVLDNDTDPDGKVDIVVDSVAIVAAPAHGTAEVKADGSIDYTPASDYSGTDTFIYTVKDSFGEVSNAATVTVIVEPRDDGAPSAIADTAETEEDKPVNIRVLDNDSDPDGFTDIQVDSVKIDTAPAHGTAEARADGTIDYTPAPEYSGTDTFTYTVNDSFGNTSNTASVTVTIAVINDGPPVAGDDTAATEEDAPVNIVVLANDTDPDGNSDIDAGSVTIVSSPAHGAVAVKPDGSVDYMPVANYSGADTFTYTVKDSFGETSTPATVTVTVTGVNDGPPVATDDVATTVEDNPVKIPVLGNDTDPDGNSDIDAGSVTLVAPPTNGTATIGADGSVDYMPAANFSGSDSFTYTVNDSFGNTSNTAEVTITVTAVNDGPPVASNDAATTQEDVPVNIAVLANDTDPDGNSDIDAGSVTLVAPPTNGTATIGADGSVEYTPAANYSGPDSFIYTVKDSAGEVSNEAAVTITIMPVNDPPLIPAGQEFSIPEYSFDPFDNFPETSVPGTVVGSVSATDVDGSIIGYSIVAVIDKNGTPLTGVFAIDDRGQITVGDSAVLLDFEAGRHPFTLTVTATDNENAVSEPQQVKVNLSDLGGAAARVGHSSLAVDICRATALNTPLLNIPVSVDSSDPALRFYLESSGSKGTASMDITGRFSYTPHSGARGVDRFTYKAVDRLGAETFGTVTIIIGNTRIMPLGDFVTVGGMRGADGGYLDELRDILTEEGYPIEFVRGQPEFPHRRGRHAGATGFTIAYMAARITDWLADNPAEIILLHTGSHDFALNGDVDVSEAQLDNTLAAIKAVNPDAIVLLAKIIDQHPANPQIPLFNSRIEKKAETGTVIIVDQYMALDYPADLADGFYPNAAGYSKMAAAWGDSLSKVLDKCP